jgi:hypothetical protein
MKNKADFKRDRKTNDVVVYDDNGKEVFRRPYNKQNLSIGNSIYFAYKYKEKGVKTNELSRPTCKI